MNNKDLYCLIGNPVSHSLSPAMHNSAFRDLSIDAVYITKLVEQNDLGNSISILKRLNVRGFNVTMPYKERVLQYIDSIDVVARKIGAVNTIVNVDGQLKGYNTDYAGGIDAVRGVMDDVKGKRALILGRGGTGRAIGYGLELLGMQTTLLGRDGMKEENLSRTIREADLVINCTPIGMDGNSSPVPGRLLRKDLVIFDAVYLDKDTKLIRDSKKIGCKTIDGIQLLLNQGALSFKLWTGIDPNREVMLRAIKAKRKLNLKNSRRNIYLVGFMGTGKSTAGKVVAEMLGRKFVDTDMEISLRLNRSIRDIFDNLGEEEFRKMEKKVIERVGRRGGRVVALGGGSVLNFENISNMKSQGTVVFLKSNPETLGQRLREDTSRPLLASNEGETRESKILSVLRSRIPYYDLAKDVEITTDGKDFRSVAREIVRRLGDFE